MRLNTRKIEIFGQAMDLPVDGDTRKTRPEAWSDRNTSDNSLSYIMRPMLIALSFAGCYNFGEINSQITEERARKYIFSFAFRLLLFVTILTFFAQKIAAFFYLPSEALLFNLLFSLWLLLCLVWFLIFWRASSKKFGKQAVAFNTFSNKIMQKFQELNLEFPVKTVRKRIILLTVLGMTLTLGNAFGSGIQFTLPTDLTIYTSPFETSGAIITIICVFQLVCSAVWIMPVMYAACITLVLKHAFIVVNKAICTALKTHACSVPPDFQKLRILHVHLCSLVSEFDHDLEWYYATLCTWHIGLSCFVLYQLIRSPLDTYLLVMFCFWLVASISMVAFGTCLAAMVNDAAHAPLDTIYYINVSDVNFEKLAQINLFLSKLTGTQVGFSTCGLLIITKEFILTIAGVFLTYFAVLYTL